MTQRPIPPTDLGQLLEPLRELRASDAIKQRVRRQALKQIRRPRRSLLRWLFALVPTVAVAGTLVVRSHNAERRNAVQASQARSFSPSFVPSVQRVQPKAPAVAAGGPLGKDGPTDPSRPVRSSAAGNSAGHNLVDLHAADRHIADRHIDGAATIRRLAARRAARGRRHLLGSPATPRVDRSPRPTDAVDSAAKPAALAHAAARGPSAKPVVTAPPADPSKGAAARDRPLAAQAAPAAVDAPVSPPPIARSVSRLTQQVAAYRRARALRGDDDRRALQLYQAWLARWPKGALAHETRLQLIDTLLALKAERALLCSALSDFDRHHPRSPRAEDLRALAQRLACPVAAAKKE
ncbi:MAG: hypothetical protein H6707_17380 [Deltaproteobacteria bacterium]|nr:hypothetical protein [Deltaproteobacteria bacterium]